jgi:chitinase
VRTTIIGYWETWVGKVKGCGEKKPDVNIPLGSLTHVNAAFAYIEPETFEIVEMYDEANRDATFVPIQDYKAVANIKTRAPKLKVWLSLGGWTFSDNDTRWQEVWSDMTSKPLNRLNFVDNLERFMKTHGFDGVDLDWEYPTAPDRRGKPDDGANYLELMKDIRSAWTNNGRSWGLSFTAPASYWYMKHFPIEEMAEVVDFVNLMTYDMHGQWDARSAQIGNRIYAHTNMSEIKDALQLLWRNNVPAEKVNLGLGFYGRTYTLEDPQCDRPGCRFSKGGNPGECTGTEGYLSYAEIKSMLERTGATPIHDNETMTKYVRFDNNQWVGYDDPETIKQKVDYANQVGFRGLFIWAIDQDATGYDLLKAALGEKGLGYFGPIGSSGWTSVARSGCEFSECGKGCDPGLVKAMENRCADGNGQLTKSLCCPLDGVPDPDFCHWTAYLSLLCGIDSASGCGQDEVLVVKDKYYKLPDGSDGACQIGKASYCCKTEQVGEKLCEWSNECVDMQDPDNHLKGCPAGTQYASFRLGDCGSGKLRNFCCSTSVDRDKLACHWTIGSEPNCAPSTCSGSEVNLGTHEGGGGVESCVTRQLGPRGGLQCKFECGGSTEVLPTLCCNKDALKVTVKKLPVKVENIFFPEDLESLPPDSITDFALLTDNTMGGRRPDNGNSDPQDNGFAWYLIDGPRDEVTTLNKRQGSDWEVYDCDPIQHEERQTAKMVCTDESPDSNCDHIFLGEVPATVLRMPDGCGPGKYAMAVSLEPDLDSLPPPHINIRNMRRGVKNPVVYKLTFDYNFSILQKRDSKALIRIDYSNNPGYWELIVEAAPGATNRKRKRSDIRREVREQHNGSWPAFLDHTYHLERRATPDHELHLLHERWFSIALDDWIRRMKKVEADYTLLRHSIKEIYDVTLFDETKQCQLAPGFPTTLGAKLKVTLDIDVQTSAQLTLIGNLGDLNSFRESHVTLRNMGTVKAILDFQAFGELRFGSLDRTLLSVAPVGAAIVIPGIVTIGPQFNLRGGLKGIMEIHANAKFQVTLSEWDYSQSYPYQGDKPYDGDDLGSKNGKDAEPNHDVANKDLGPQFSYDIGASGGIEAHLIPTVTFGIVWNEKWGVGNAAVLDQPHLDAFARRP